MNLAVNARDAMPGGGTLTVRTANVEMTQGSGARRGSMTPGSYVLLVGERHGHWHGRRNPRRIFSSRSLRRKKLARGRGWDSRQFTGS